MRRRSTQALIVTALVAMAIVLANRVLRQDGAEARVFDVAAVDPQVLPIDPPGSLSLPVHLRAYGDEFYVIDWGDNRVKRLSPHGRLLGTIVDAVGQGPGEVATTFDYAVLDDRVYVLDATQRRILVFTTDGAFVSQTSVREFAQRMVIVGDTIVLLTPSEVHLFLQLDLDGNEIRRFGDFIGENVTNRMALHGPMISLGSDGFVFVTQYAGHVFFFDVDGGLRRRHSTIDGLPFPAAATDGSAQDAPTSRLEASIETHGASIVDDELHLYTFFRGDGEREPAAAIDRYDVKTGAYVGSIDVPPANLAPVILDGVLYYLDAANLTTYRLVAVE